MEPPTHPQYITKEYRKGMENQIVELLNKGFNGWPKIDINCSPKEYWRWKYLDNPTGIINMHVVLDQDKMICCDHGQPRRIKIDDKIRTCACRGDLTVDQDYRGKGVWSFSNDYATYTEKRDKFELVYYLTGNEKIIKRMSKIRPRFPRRLANWFKLEDFDKHVEHMPIEREWLVKAGFNVLKALNTKKNSELDCDTEIREITEFGSKFHDFWESIKNEYKFILERTPAYLNWRYTDPRPGKHTIYAAIKDNEIIGYIVLRINNFIKDYPIGYIVDLLTIDNSVSHALVEQAVEYFEKNQINLVNCLMVNGSKYDRSLRQNGFIDSRLPIHIFYQNNTIEDLFLGVTPRQLHFTWGDHDSLPHGISRT